MECTIRWTGAGMSLVAETGSNHVLVMDGAGTEACASRVCGSSEQFARVAGDVTLDYAMRYLNQRSQSSARPKR